MNIVLFINSLSNSGGTEKVSTLLANNLAQDNNVLFISRLKSHPFFVLDKNIKYIYLGKENENIFLNYLKYIFLIVRLLKKNKIDKWIDVSTSLSLISVPCKLFCHFEIYAWEHFNLTWEWNWLTAKMSRYLACHFAKNVVVLTQTDKARFQEKYKTNNIVCVPNPVSIKKVVKSDEEAKIVLSIGRHTYQKGQDMMLDMWYLTKCRHEGWRLKIVGSGELEAELRNQIGRLNIGDSVEMLPVTNNVERLYAEASVFILTSRWEGLPLALIEAISAGLPIVSFDCETGPRDVVEDSLNGYLIDCFDINEFAQKLDGLCVDREVRMKFAEQSVVKSRDFSPTTFYEDCDRLLLEKG